MSAGLLIERLIDPDGQPRDLLSRALAAMLGALFILDDPIFSGLAVSLIFGIFVSTALTLVVIPLVYYAVRYRTAGSR